MAERAAKPVTDEETRAQRDSRVRAEENRLVRLEDGVKATRELMTQVREDVRGIADDLHGHLTDDEQRFASVDSRLQGVQSQLSSISTQLETLTRNREDVLANSRKIGDLMSAVYTPGGINRVEVLWQERHDSDVRGSVWKRQAALITSGGVGVMLLRVLAAYAGLDLP